MKDLLSLIAIALTFIAYIPYIVSTYKGQTKPHTFSWIIWGLTTFIVFLAQLADKGGVGAWPIGVSGIITFYVAWLAWQHKADSDISRIDWAFFIIALLSLPFWYFSSDPLWAVIILTTIDTLGFGPTLRKAYYAPYDEQILFYALFAIRNLFATLALEHYSLTTVLFPVVTGAGCLLVILLLAIQRSRLDKVVKK